MTDTRTAEQHMADIADCCLARLARLDDELAELGWQLEVLAPGADDDDQFYAAAFAVYRLRDDVPEAVREVAAKLRDAARPRRRHLAVAKHQPAQHTPTEES